MIYLLKLLEKNHINVSDFKKDLNEQISSLGGKLYLRINFKIEDLEIIKEYFIEKKILKEDFDIGKFLDMV